MISPPTLGIMFILSLDTYDAAVSRSRGRRSWHTSTRPGYHQWAQLDRLPTSLGSW